jgi:predicted transcriptional regulator
VAERMATPTAIRRLSPRETAAIERSRADFAAGRVLDEAEYEAAMAVFMAKLEAEASSTP